MQEVKIIQQSKSFKNLDRTLTKLAKMKKSKLAGDVFEYLTKLYLEVSPEYKTKIKKVHLLKEIPTALKRKLKLPNTDEGIDLVAETFDNQYWAIQCKYRSNKTETLKVKGDLATLPTLFTAPLTALPIDLTRLPNPYNCLGICPLEIGIISYLILFFQINQDLA